MTLLDDQVVVARTGPKVSLRMERRRAKRRLQLERTLVLLCLPVAVALTVAVLLLPPGNPLEARRTSTVIDVRIEGALPRAVVERLGGLAVATATPVPEAAAPPVTEVVYYHPDDRRRAGEVRDRLGMGTLVLGRLRPGGVDLTITVGKDLSQE